MFLAELVDLLVFSSFDPLSPFPSIPMPVVYMCRFLHTHARLFCITLAAQCLFPGCHFIGKACVCSLDAVAVTFHNHCNHELFGGEIVKQHTS